MEIWKLEKVEILETNTSIPFEKNVEKKTDLLEKGNLKKLTKLSARDVGIVDITGIEHRINLYSLDLGVNVISDISGLRKLTNLTELDIAANNISDLSALVNLSKLDYLAADNNNISNVSAIQNLTKLKRLFLTNNVISDISPIAENKGVSGIVKLKDNPLKHCCIIYSYSCVRI